jgi:hypothetical protein
MSRQRTATERLVSRLKSRDGVSVVYLRNVGQSGEQRLALTVVALGHRSGNELNQNNQVGRFDYETRDYLIEVADLVEFGLEFEPSQGDRILETINGVEKTYLICPNESERCWRHTDQTQVAIRVHTKEV